MIPCAGGGGAWRPGWWRRRAAADTLAAVQRRLLSPGISFQQLQPLDQLLVGWLGLQGRAVWLAEHLQTKTAGSRSRRGGVRGGQGSGRQVAKQAVVFWLCGPGEVPQAKSRAKGEQQPAPHAGQGAALQACVPAPPAITQVQ